MTTNMASSLWPEFYYYPFPRAYFYFLDTRVNNFPLHPLSRSNNTFFVSTDSPPPLLFWWCFFRLPRPPTPQFLTHFPSSPFLFLSVRTPRKWNFSEPPYLLLASSSSFDKTTTSFLPFFSSSSSSNTNTIRGVGARFRASRSPLNQIRDDGNIIPPRRLRHHFFLQHPLPPPFLSPLLVSRLPVPTTRGAIQLGESLSSGNNTATLVWKKRNRNVLTYPPFQRQREGKWRWWGKPRAGKSDDVGDSCKVGSLPKHTGGFQLSFLASVLVKRVAETGAVPSKRVRIYIFVCVDLREVCM